jgi:hypothetical protein
MNAALLSPKGLLARPGQKCTLKPQFFAGNKIIVDRLVNYAILLSNELTMMREPKDEPSFKHNGELAVRELQAANAIENIESKEAGERHSISADWAPGLRQIVDQSPQ